MFASPSGTNNNLRTGWTLLRSENVSETETFVVNRHFSGAVRRMLRLRRARCIVRTRDTSVSLMPFACPVLTRMRLRGGRLQWGWC